MLPTVYLAAEDEPGLAVGRKLIAEAPPLSVYREENGHGVWQVKKHDAQLSTDGLSWIARADDHGFGCAQMSFEHD
jgi:hypothetical protein